MVGSTGSISREDAANASLGGVKSDSLGLAYLIKAYQSRGHEAANLDPFGSPFFSAEKLQGSWIFNTTASLKLIWIGNLTCLGMRLEVLQGF